MGWNILNCRHETNEKLPYVFYMMCRWCLDEFYMICICFLYNCYMIVIWFPAPLVCGIAIVTWVRVCRVGWGSGVYCGCCRFDLTTTMLYAMAWHWQIWALNFRRGWFSTCRDRSWGPSGPPSQVTDDCFAAAVCKSCRTSSSDPLW